MAPGTDVGIALLTAESGLPIGLRLGTDDADATHAVLHAAGAEIGEEVLRLISHRRCSLSATPTTTCSSQLRIGKKRTPAGNAGDLTRWATVSKRCAWSRLTGSHS